MSKLLEQVKTTARLRHLSLRTEKVYLQHVKRFILFHGTRHPRELGEDHIRDYLSDLVINKNVSASTQNVALASLLFLYRDRKTPTHRGSANSFLRNDSCEDEALVYNISRQRRWELRTMIYWRRKRDRQECLSFYFRRARLGTSSASVASSGLVTVGNRIR
jgi:hypothetical protein